MLGRYTLKGSGGLGRTVEEMPYFLKEFGTEEEKQQWLQGGGMGPDPADLEAGGSAEGAAPAGDMVIVDTVPEPPAPPQTGRWRKWLGYTGVALGAVIVISGLFKARRS